MKNANNILHAPWSESAPDVPACMGKPGGAGCGASADAVTQKLFSVNCPVCIHLILSDLRQTRLPPLRALDRSELEPES